MWRTYYNIWVIKEKRSGVREEQEKQQMQMEKTDEKA